MEGEFSFKAKKEETQGQQAIQKKKGEADGELAGGSKAHVQGA